MPTVLEQVNADLRHKLYGDYVVLTAAEGQLILEHMATFERVIIHDPRPVSNHDADLEIAREIVKRLVKRRRVYREEDEL